MSVEISFSERLKDLRSEAGYKSQEALAEKLRGIDRTTIADWETDRRKPKFDQIIELSKALNTSCDMLLRGVRPEYVNLHNTSGLSGRAIEILELFEHSASFNQKGVKSLGNLISDFLESDGKLGDFIEAYIGYKIAASRSIDTDKNRLVEAKAEAQQRVQEYTAYSKWSQENGFIAIPPSEAEKYYFYKMANAFVGAIEEKTQAVKKSEERSIDMGLSLLEKERSTVQKEEK